MRRANSGQGLGAVPVGVVSKRYCLVPHIDVAQSVRSALAASGVHPSSPLRMLVGWSGSCCANGLAVGTTQSELRLVHREGSMCGDVGELLREGIALAGREQAGLRLWLSLQVPLARFVSFADDEDRRRLGRARGGAVPAHRHHRV